MEMPVAMKQWELSQYKISNLKLNTASVPTPKPGEVLVKTEAVSLNYRDLLVGDTGMGMDLKFPFVPASDLAGKVIGLGENVTRFQLNDSVISTNIAGWIDGIAPPPHIAPSLGGIAPGVLTQYICLPEDWLSLAPKTLTPNESATLPCAALTAWVAVVERGNLKKGETVVIQGTGGVALFAIQFAVAQGATVIVTSSSDQKLEKAKKYGATYGINRSQYPDWQEKVLELTDNKGADLIIEMAGSDNLQKSLDTIAQEGRIAIVGLLDSAIAKLSIFKILATRSTLLGIGVGSRKSLEAMCEYIDLHRIRPVIDATYHFNKVPEAFQHLSKGAFGKIVIEVN